MASQTLLALVAALVLTAVHLFSGRLRFLDGVPRSAWLSAFGGISVAYVFVHLLPELAEGQEAIEGAGGDEAGALLGFLEHHVYLMALLGLIIFYGVERHSLASRHERRMKSGEDRTHDDAFRLSVGSFTVYNAIVGYLLLRGDLEGASALAIYTLALAVHFVVTDFGLRDHHKDAYTRTARWIVSAGVLGGWAIGTFTEVPERVIALVIAFIAGGIVLNVLKEELPGERRARMLPFLAGTAGFTVLLQFT